MPKLFSPLQKIRQIFGREKVPPAKKRAPFEKWKKPEDIRWLKFKKCIGEGEYGKVFVGKIIFRDGSSQRVAIKKFRPEYEINNEMAASYRRVIERLAKASVPIPKMEMVKFLGEWYQVSQLFAKWHKAPWPAKWKLFKPKISMHHPLERLTYEKELKNKKFRDEAIDIMIKVIDAGYPPHPDILETLTMARGKSPIPIDLDLIVREEKRISMLRGVPITVAYFVRFVPEKDRRNTALQIIERIKDAKIREAVMKELKEQKLI